MSHSITGFIFQIFGAFIVWAFKGFKGSLDDEIAKAEGDSWKKYRNFIISALILLLVGYLINNNNESKKERITGNYYEFIKTK